MVYVKLVKIIFCQCCWKSSSIFIVFMAIISALFDLARNRINTPGTLCCKDVVINKSSLKHFYTNLKKKQGIKWSKEKSTYNIIGNAVFVNPPIKRILYNPQRIYYGKNQCQNLSDGISKILKVLLREKKKTSIQFYYIECLLENRSK